MSTTVYFSKLNFQSHISDVLSGTLELRSVLRLLHRKLDDDIEYIQSTEFIDDDGEVHTNEVEYRIGHVIKDGPGYQNSIAGIMYKKHKLYHNTENDEGLIIRTAVDNIETVSFYLDVYKERVAFFTTQRFGYEQFNNALSGIINNALSEHEYEFDVDTIVESMNFDDIIVELGRIGRISELKIDVKLPNPGDADIEALVHNGEQFIERYKDAGVAKKSVILRSSRSKSIVLDSELIKEEIKEVSEIHSMIPPETAIANGYVEIDAIGQNSKFSTKQNRPKKSIIEDSQKLLHEFMAVAHEFINTLF